MPDIVLIAAVAEENRVIGKDKDLPWHLPEDLKRFKRLTTGHPLLMGRHTFESVVHQFGGPLPNRRMMVLTTQGLPDYPDIETYSSIDAAMAAVADADVVYIGGGGDIYKQFLPRADRMELTLVEGAHAGDTYFPPFKHLVGDVFTVAREEPHDGFRFVTYVRADGTA
ncbi:dihydrofolate reductase [Salisaeta longa]|uniref:dihydrofolate reductase n=1 Tax=Salisaeta longa TaxID=503170 RepID=UPI0003B79729|nr:dihydrofolate reductase [Salisaeta longa]